MDDVYENIEEYLANKKQILIVFDDLIDDILSNKKIYPVVTDLFIRGRKINVFITQSYFSVPKRYQTKYYALLFMKILNKREHQQITFKHSSDTDF